MYNPRRIAIIALIGLVTLMVVKTARAETLTELASRMALHPVTVSCIDLSKTGDDGESAWTYDSNGNFVEGYIWLSKGTCVGIRALERHVIYSAHLQGNNLATVLHEALHIRLNSKNESRVECTAMFNLWNWITPFGFSARKNHSLYLNAWEHHMALPNNYKKGCEMMPGYKVKPMKIIIKLEGVWYGSA